MKLPISVVILTYNEEKNIEECLKSVYGWVEDIFIVDSGSTDKTLEITKRYTDKIYTHDFENQAKQLNWGLKNLPIDTKWIMRLDADERVTDELKNELLEKLTHFSESVTCLYLKRRVYFMNKWIRHGGYYPTWILRIWKANKAICEMRCMGEHMKIKEGRPAFLKYDIIEANRKNLHWWIGKHNNYALREAIDLLKLENNFIQFDSVTAKFFGTQEQRKRWLTERIYAKSPLFVRAFLYFILRYLIKMGFLDGIEGLIWHFLQGFWYRFLVDAKIYELKKYSHQQNKSIKVAFKELYGYEI